MELVVEDKEMKITELVEEVFMVVDRAFKFIHNTGRYKLY